MISRTSRDYNPLLEVSYRTGRIRDTSEEEELGGRVATPHKPLPTVRVNGAAGIAGRARGRAPMPPGIDRATRSWRLAAIGVNRHPRCLSPAREPMPDIAEEAHRGRSRRADLT